MIAARHPIKIIIHIGGIPVKKALALILCLALLFSCACAEESSSKFDMRLFTFEYPVDYLPIYSATIDKILSDPEILNHLLSAGFDTSALDLIKNGTVAGLCGPDFTGRMDITTSIIYGINMNHLYLNKRQMFSNYVKQFASLGISEDEIEFLGFTEFGTNAYFSMKINHPGLEAEVYIICNNKGTLCNFSFYSPFDETARDMILSSFAYK